MEREPNLNEFGFYCPYPDQRSFADEERRHKSAREALVQQFDVCMLVREWLKANAAKTKTIRNDSWSYKWKHTVEHAIGHYVGNGTFILAALSLGFSYSRQADSVNCSFNFAPIRRRAS
jgi:hypothetical protein